MIETKNRNSKKYLIPILFLLVLFFSWKFFTRERRVLGISTKIKTVSVNDGGFTESIETNANSVEEFLEEQGVEINDRDIIYPSKNSLIVPGSQINIERIKNVSVVADGETVGIYGFKDSVEEILKENNVSFKEEDIIKPARDTFAYNNLEIKITRVEIKEETEEEPIKFKTIEEEDNKLSWRTKKVTQKGIEGVKEIKYEVAYHDGEEVSRKIIETNIVKEPVNEIVTQGTYVKLGKSHKGQGTWYDQSYYPNMLKRYPFEGNMFAANPWLPLGSYAKVTNTDNGESVIVRINDRGPFGDGRIIDLNKVAFAKIASIDAGVINVKVEEIKN